MTKNSLFTVTNALFYFLHAILCPEHTIPQKTISIAHFAIVARDDLFWLSIVTSPGLICGVTRPRGTGTVASYSSIVLARANWRKGITTVNIDFSPPGIHGLACKKRHGNSHSDNATYTLKRPLNLVLPVQKFPSWCRGLTTCLLHVGPPFGNRF